MSASHLAKQLEEAKAEIARLRKQRIRDEIKIIFLERLEPTQNEIVVDTQGVPLNEKMQEMVRTEKELKKEMLRIAKENARLKRVAEFQAPHVERWTKALDQNVEIVLQYKALIDFAIKIIPNFEECVDLERTVNGVPKVTLPDGSSPDHRVISYDRFFAYHRGN